MHSKVGNIRYRASSPLENGDTEAQYQQIIRHAPVIPEIVALIPDKFYHIINVIYSRNRARE
jgi:hypothetical protein